MWLYDQQVMDLSAKITADLTAAMKARDAVTTATLRSVLAAIKNLRVAEGHAGEVTDEETTELVAREAKKRREAIDAYRDAGRPELVEREEQELAVLTRYLPEQLGDEDIRALVDDAVTQAGAAAPGDFGKVMSVLMPKVKGRADGKVVAALVRQRLGG